MTLLEVLHDDVIEATLGFEYVAKPHMPFDIGMWPCLLMWQGLMSKYLNGHSFQSGSQIKIKIISLENSQ